MAVDSGYGRYGFGSLFTNEGIMEREMTEEQKNVAAMKLRNASKNKKRPKKSKSRPQYASEPQSIHSNTVVDPAYDVELGDDILILMGNQNAGWVLEQGQLINMVENKREDGLLFKVKATDGRKVVKRWVTSKQFLSRVISKDYDDLDEFVHPPEETKNDFHGEEQPDQSYYESDDHSIHPSSAKGRGE